MVQKTNFRVQKVLVALQNKFRNTSGQSYKASMSVNYDTVILISKLLPFTT